LFDGLQKVDALLLYLKKEINSFSKTFEFAGIAQRSSVMYSTP
jgi:hypothetical protein